MTALPHSALVKTENQILYEICCPGLAEKYQSKSERRQSFSFCLQKLEDLWVWWASSPGQAVPPHLPNEDIALDAVLVGPVHDSVKARQGSRYLMHTADLVTSMKNTVAVPAHSCPG